MTVRELGPGETALAARTLLQLRPGLGSPEAFEAGAGEAGAVAGFRVNEFLAWGRHLYVDDLVTADGHRGRGLADRLFAWLEEEARNCGCTQLHLDSGVGEDRQDAHRFYFRHGLRISSYHFQREL